MKGLFWRAFLCVFGLNATLWVSAWLDARKERREAEQRAHDEEMARVFAQVRRAVATKAAGGPVAASGAAPAPKPGEAPEDVVMRLAAAKASHLPNGQPMTASNTRAWLRDQGVSEIRGDGDKGVMTIGLPAPIPLSPRSIEGDEVRAAVPLPLPDAVTFAVVYSLHRMAGGSRLVKGKRVLS